MYHKALIIIGGRMNTEQLAILAAELVDLAEHYANAFMPYPVKEAPDDNVEAVPSDRDSAQDWYCEAMADAHREKRPFVLTLPEDDEGMFADKDPENFGILTLRLERIGLSYRITSPVRPNPHFNEEHDNAEVRYFAPGSPHIGITTVNDCGLPMLEIEEGDWFDVAALGDRASLAWTRVNYPIPALQLTGTVHQSSLLEFEDFNEEEEAAGPE